MYYAVFDSGVTGRLRLCVHNLLNTAGLPKVDRFAWPGVELVECKPTGDGYTSYYKAAVPNPADETPPIMYSVVLADHEPVHAPYPPLRDDNVPGRLVGRVLWTGWEAGEPPAEEPEVQVPTFWRVAVADPNTDGRDRQRAATAVHYSNRNGELWAYAGPRSYSPEREPAFAEYLQEVARYRDGEIDEDELDDQTREFVGRL